MPRYFFNIYDGTDAIDEVGVELPGIRAMRIHMIDKAKKIVEARLFPHDIWQMEALDEAGEIVGTMEFGLQDRTVTRQVTPLSLG